MRSALLLRRHASVARARLLSSSRLLDLSAPTISRSIGTSSELLRQPNHPLQTNTTSTFIGRTSETPMTSKSVRVSLPATSIAATQFRFQSTKPDDDNASTSKAAAATAATSRDEDDKDKVNKKPLLLDLGIPSLIPEWKNMFNSSTIFTDISAGITVGCIAVPLSLAIALASGVPAEVGLVTAAVSGVAGGLLGGTTLAVTGPAAAISLLVVGAVQQHGLEALPFITLATGGMQLASGVTRVGVVAKLVPVSVIAGFTTGVGTLILSGQIPKALGMTAPQGLNPVELMGYVASHLGDVNPASAALAIGTSAAMFALPKVHPKIPSALIAVGGATAATHMFGLDVSLIGQLPSGMDAFQFGIPSLPSVDSIPSLAATTLLIYSMTSVESLLSCAALEKMKKTTYKHNPDQELIGQGLANMGSAFFMGMPVTSVIARSGLNVRLNASTRLPALVQSGFVFSSVAFMSSSIALIPMPALSGVLITTGLGMLNPDEFKHCYAVQKADVVPFLTTIAGMLSMGLAEGIGIGCVTALAMELKNTNFSLDASRMKFVEVDLPAATSVSVSDAGSLSSATENESGQVWKISGPINFVSMFEIDDMMQYIKEREAPVDAPIVLDMEGVSTLEFTGVEEMVNRLVEVSDGTPVHMLNCSEALNAALDQCDPKKQITRM